MNFKAMMLLLSFALGAFANEAPKQMPSFTLPDIQGNAVKAEWSGRVVVLDFWATWCVACRDAFPVLNALQSKYGSSIQVVGVSSDKSGADKVKKFVKKYDLQYLILHDQTDQLSGVFKYTSLPTLLVYDQKGKLQLTLQGLDEANAAKMQKTIQQLLGK